jgi:hypothetical protein
MGESQAASATPTPDQSQAHSTEPSAAYEPMPTDPPPAGLSGSSSVAGPQLQNAIGFVFGAAVQQVARVVKPQAAVVVAAAFGFPLILSIAVVLFLLAQGWVDARDPKLRLAPQTAVESVVPFKDEEQI